MGETVRTLMNHLEIRSENINLYIEGHTSAGDTWAMNDPFQGGSHLPDITVITPVFGASPEPVAWVACRAHHADVGGITPGSMPPFSRTLDDEGVRLGFLLLARDGEIRTHAVTAALSSGPHPARDVAGCIADLEAQVAANALGARLLGELFDRVGHDVASAYMGHIQSNGASIVRAWVEELGSHPRVFRGRMDDGTPIQVRLRRGLDPSRRTTLIVDFEGTGPASKGNLNAPPAVARAAVLYVVRCLVGRAIPLNEGCLDAIDIRIPSGSLLNPPPGSAVVGGNVETSQRIVDVLFGALGACAAAQGTMNNLTFGSERFGYYETICGGAGAGPGRPGAHGVHTHMTNTRITDVEVLEARCPVRLRRFELRKGSGGSGASPGGDGVVRSIEFLEPMRVSLLSERRSAAPFGLRGGGPGALGEAILHPAGGGTPEQLPGCFSRDVQPGDVLEILTPGGGGFGEPVEVL
jgi:5-oxoprolinase (ATP-hydrolysing)